MFEKSDLRKKNNEEIIFFIFFYLQSWQLLKQRSKTIYN